MLREGRERNGESRRIRKLKGEDDGEVVGLERESSGTCFESGTVRTASEGMVSLRGFLERVRIQVDSVFSPYDSDSLVGASFMYYLRLCLPCSSNERNWWCGHNSISLPLSRT